MVKYQRTKIKRYNYLCLTLYTLSATAKTYYQKIGREVFSRSGHLFVLLKGLVLTGSDSELEAFRGNNQYLLAVCSWCLPLVLFILLVKSPIFSAASSRLFSTELFLWSNMLSLVVQDIWSEKTLNLRGLGPRLLTFFV